MNRKEKRKRISQNFDEPIVDSNEWLENCTSKKVRFHSIFAENYEIEF